MDARIAVSALLLTAGGHGSPAVPATAPDRLSSVSDTLLPLGNEEEPGGPQGGVPASVKDRDIYSVALRARSRTPAVVPTYMSSVMR